MPPENILFNTTGSPFLSDFGIATTLADHGTGSRLTGSRGGSPGSPGYQSPEAQRGEKLVSSDQFSLAITSYEALSGKLPFEGQTETALFVAMARWEIIPLQTRCPSLPEDLSAAVMRAISAHVKDRFLSCSEFAATLEAARRKGSAPASEIKKPDPEFPPNEPTPSPPALKGRSIPLLGAALAILALLGAWLVREESNSPQHVDTRDNSLAKQQSSTVTPEPKTQTNGAKQVPTPTPSTPLDGETSSNDKPTLPSPLRALQPTHGDQNRNAAVRSAGLEQKKDFSKDAGARQLRTINTGEYPLAFSPNSSIFATGASSLEGQNSITLWDVASGHQLRTLGGFSNTVPSVAFSPDGRTLAAVFNQVAIKLLDVSTGSEFELQSYRRGIAVVAIAFSADGRILASGNSNKIKLWDVASKRELRTLGALTDVVTSISFSPDGRIVAASSNGSIKLWDTTNGGELHALPAGAGAVLKILFSADGQSLMSFHNDGTIKFFDVASGRETRSSQLASGSITNNYALSKDGRVVATESRNSKTTRILEAATGIQLGTLNGQFEAPRGFVFSTDGHLLAFSTFTGIILWDTAGLLR